MLYLLGNCSFFRNVDTTCEPPRFANTHNFHNSIVYPLSLRQLFLRPNEYKSKVLKYPMYLLVIVVKWIQFLQNPAQYSPCIGSQQNKRFKTYLSPQPASGIYQLTMVGPPYSLLRWSAELLKCDAAQQMGNCGIHFQSSVTFMWCTIPCYSCFIHIDNQDLLFIPIYCDHNLRWIVPQ